MRYAERNCTEFVLVVYSNATQLAYSLIALLAMARKVIWILSVRPSVLGIGSYFFLEPHMVLGAYVVLCMTAKFFEKNVLPLKWGK